MKIKKLKIGNRLGLGFALILVFLIVSTLIGIIRLQAIADATRSMMEQPLVKERMISDWYRYVYAGIGRTTAVVKSTDPSLGPFFAEDSANVLKKSQDLKKHIIEMVSGNEEKALFDKLAKVSKLFLTTRTEIGKAKEAGNHEEAQRIFELGFLPASKEYESIVQQLLDLQRKSIDATAKQVDAVAEDSRRLMIVLAVIVVMLSVLCAWRLTISITRPIAKAVAMARRIADGKLLRDDGVNVGASSKDESAQLLSALADMNARLVSIVLQIRIGSDTISTASNEIAAGNLDLSSRTELQASSLQETASSVEELTATVKQNAENAHQANQLAIEAAEVAAQGGAIVSEVVKTMESINAASHKIVDIISVIDSIAFQTNILALNAAVEAARAGEQGRGFAVVASEVRSLAQRSAAAARDIKGLISSSVEKIGTGSALANRAGATMNNVVASVQSVTSIMAEISTASNEQRAGIEQVSRAIAHMDQVTQHNAALVEEAAAAAAFMHEQSNQLTLAVGAFDLAEQVQIDRSELKKAEGHLDKPLRVWQDVGASILT